MAAPIKDSTGTNWGLLQLSDKYEGEFSEANETQFVRFAQLVSMSLEALWQARNLKEPFLPGNNPPRPGRNRQPTHKPPIEPASLRCGVIKLRKG